MNKIFMIIGRSGSGKDTQVQIIHNKFDMHSIVLCTTRKPRAYETFGKDYYFVTDAVLRSDQIKDDVFECRQLNLTTGPAYYYTRKSSIDLTKFNYIVPGTFDMLRSYRGYFGNNVVPIFLECDYKTARRRLLERNSEPMSEIDRRLITDEQEYTRLNTLKYNIPLENIVYSDAPKWTVSFYVIKIMKRYVEGELK